MNVPVSKLVEATRLAIDAIEQLQRQVAEQQAELARVKADLPRKRGVFARVFW